MACSLPVEVQNESIRAIVSQLPQADSLPDGFSEGTSEASKTAWDMAKDTEFEEMGEEQDHDVSSPNSQTLLRHLPQATSPHADFSTVSGNPTWIMNEDTKFEEREENLDQRVRSSDAIHLPHADSLPDGFSDGTLETGNPISDVANGIEFKRTGVELPTSHADVLSELAPKISLGDPIVIDTAWDRSNDIEFEERGDNLDQRFTTMDSLPDGFVESFTDVSVTVHSTNCITSPEVFGIDADSIVNGIICKDTTTELAEDSIEVAQADPVPSEAATSSNDNKERVLENLEKYRRFPVPLSEGNADNAENATVILPSTSSRDDNQKETSLEAGTASKAGLGVETIPSSSTKLQPTSIPANCYRKQQILGEVDVSSLAQLKAGNDLRFRESGKSRKKRVKEVKTMLDGSDRTSDEKLKLLHSKYLHQVAEADQLDKELMSLRQRVSYISRENDALSSDLSKGATLRQKLESLCRELQRQNKILIDENKKIATEEQQRRQELSTRFHDTIKEISIKLDEQGDERTRQINENEMLKEKLNQFEEHFTHQLRTKSLESQILEVKLKQQEELYLQEEAKTRIYTEEIKQLLTTEKDLRLQLAVYGEKFDQFQDTLTKSNEVFSSFKQEMEKMSKTIKNLEKENLGLRKKMKESNKSIIELVEERGAQKSQIDTLKNQKEKLEQLCRSLQAERKQLRATAAEQQEIKGETVD